jgi:ubiquitin C-terminal hydrolase
MNSTNAGNKGLANLGNTCYMNAALQCLSHLLEFHPKNEHFLNENKNKDDIYCEWLKLQLELWQKGGEQPIVPRSFLQQFMSDCQTKGILFHNFQQNDTEEFITIFMDLLHQSIKKKIKIRIEGSVTTEMDTLAMKAINSWSSFFQDDYSYIIKKFYSQLLSITSCPQCDYVTVNFDPCMVLSIAIPDKASSLVDCLDSYTTKTTLDCDNSWKCDKCKELVQPDKKIIFWKSADTLIILLKRYSNRSKKDNFIEFPLDLDISSYSLNFGGDGTTYKLSGICIQSGSLGGGHYYAMCKNELDQVWREYNDTGVRVVEESELLKQKPYCLFYRRI